MRPPISKSITIAARMNGPLPPDLGTGGVVSDIRALHFGHQLVENRRLSGGDYSYPTDRARGFLRVVGRGSRRRLRGIVGRRLEKPENRDGCIAPTTRVASFERRILGEGRR